VYRIYDVEICLYFYVVPLLNVVIFCRIWMPVLCPVVLVHVLLYCLLVLRYVCFLALEMTLCMFVRVLSLVVPSWALRLNGSFTGLFPSTLP